MTIELKVPQVGESITEVQIGQWMVEAGAKVEKDQPLVEIETDKVTLELPAPVAGTLARVLKQKGAQARVGEVIGYLEAAAATDEVPAPPPVQSPADQPAGHRPAESAPGEPYHQEYPQLQDQTPPPPPPPEDKPQAPRVMPAARRALAQEGLEARQVMPTGPGGRLLKEDVQRHAAAAKPAPEQEQTRPAPAAAPLQEKPPAKPQTPKPPSASEQPAAHQEPTAGPARQERLTPMSPMRKRIAQRLVEAQQAAALLTTFNEIDMTAVMELRQKHREAFLERHQVKLGFMSFFVKATVYALGQVPQVNAEIRGDQILSRDYMDIGVAIGGGKGLVVPVLRDAQFLSFAQIEKTIADFAERAAENRITLEDLRGGTFSISNGGVYGSLLSTPIVNPPQSGILGLHAIQDRPVARDKQVVIRPMMYVALTYDHRLVDGREAVSFLRYIKDVIEDPARLLLEV